MLRTGNKASSAGVGAELGKKKNKLTYENNGHISFLKMPVFKLTLVPKAGFPALAEGQEDGPLVADIKYWAN